MASPFLGEIITFAGNFTIRHYAGCNGQIISTDQNTALFSLLSNTYGGDGRTTFALPDLRGRVPVAPGNSPGTSRPWQQGDRSGLEAVSLTTENIPAHNHSLNVSTLSPNTASPAYAMVGKGKQYASTTTLVKEMYAETVGNTGNNEPVSLMAPFLATNFMIAISGLYPSRS